MEKLDIKAIKISQRIINNNKIKTIKPIKSKKYKKLTDEATERIRLQKIEDAKVIRKCQDYIAK